MKNYRAMHEQLLLQLAPLVAEENEAPEVMKERFRKRRSIGVLTRTGDDGVKRAHFFGRAGVRPLRPPKTGFHFPEAETSTSSASAGVLLYSEQQGGGRAISSEAEQKQVRHLLLNNELHPFVIGRLARSPSCTSSASTSCEMTPIHESAPFSSSDEEGDGDDLDHTHGEINGQHRTRRMFKALAVGIYPAALQPHKNDHEDTWALAKEEKQKAASSTNMQNQNDENHASWREGDRQKCKMLTNKADKRAILGSFTPGQGRRESAAVAWRK